MSTKDKAAGKDNLNNIKPTPAPTPDCGPGIDPDKFPPKAPKTPIDPRVQLKNTNSLKK